MPFDAAQVDRSGAAQGVRPLVGDARQRAPAIVGIGPAIHQPGLGHAVHEAGEPAAAQHHPVGQVAHAQLTARVVQADEHVVPGEGELPLGLQLAVEDVDQDGVGTEEGAPRLEAGGIRSGGHAASIIAGATSPPGRCSVSTWSTMP